MSHQTDWDRGFEAGKAQGAVDAFAKQRDLEQQVEKAKRNNSRSMLRSRIAELEAAMGRAEERAWDEGAEYVLEACGEVGPAGPAVDALYARNPYRPHPSPEPQTPPKTAKP